MQIIKTKNDIYKLIIYENKNYRINYNTKMQEKELIKFNNSIKIPIIIKEFKNENDLLNFLIDCNIFDFKIRQIKNDRIFHKLDNNILRLRYKENSETGEIESLELSDELIKKINYNRFKSEKRSKKSFYDYALSTSWQYFTTFTFKNYDIRHNKNEIKKMWYNFKTQLQKINNDVKILSVIEQHENGGYHLHALITNIQLAPYLKIAINKKTNEIIKDSFNNIIYNLDLWKNGFSTVAIIPQDLQTQQKVVNYLIKYVNKSPCTNYLEKRFLKTQNLKKRMYYLGDSSINDILYNETIKELPKFKEIKNKDGDVIFEIFKKT